MDRKRGAVARSEVDGRASRGEPSRGLEQRGIEPARRDRRCRLFAKSVGPHRARQDGLVTQPLEVNRHIQRRPAKPSRIGEQVPQHFAEEQDTGRPRMRIHV